MHPRNEITIFFIMYYEVGFPTIFIFVRVNLRMQYYGPFINNVRANRGSLDLPPSFMRLWALLNKTDPLPSPMLFLFQGSRLECENYQGVCLFLASGEPKMGSNINRYCQGSTYCLGRADEIRNWIVAVAKLRFFLPPPPVLMFYINCPSIS